MECFGNFCIGSFLAALGSLEGQSIWHRTKEFGGRQTRAQGPGDGNRIESTFHGTQGLGSMEAELVSCFGNLFFISHGELLLALFGILDFWGSWQEQPMEAENWPMVVELLMFCLSWEGDPGKKRVMEEF